MKDGSVCRESVHTKTRYQSSTNIPGIRIIVILLSKSIFQCLI